MKSIKELAKLIKKGGVMVCPTDTVYGLLCDATNKKAVERIFKIKKRSKNKAFPIFIKDLKTAKKLAKIEKWQEDFLKKVWPGKTTVILKIKPRPFTKGRGKIYGIKRETIALRIPNDKLVLKLLKMVNKPLVGTSANISGKPPTTKIKEVLRQLKDKPDLIIDAGNLKPSKPSKVIDLTNKKPKILRR